MVITIFDAMGIQEYLFGSNRLAENIGASYLVNQALSEWPLEAAMETVPGRVNPIANNIPVATPGIFDKQSFDIELLYSAGGNAVFACKDIETAKKFAGIYSRKLYERAPGLDVACYHHQINDSAKRFNLGENLWEALDAMSASKNYRFTSSPLTGMGVTERCASGNEEIAISQDPTQKGRLIGPSALAKIKNSIPSRNHLRAFLNREIPEDCDLPSELDQLGRSRGEKSFVGVCHIDGNGVGKSLQHLLWNQNSSSHADQLQFIRNFSKKITNAGTHAVRSVMEQVSRNWDPVGKKYGGRIDLHVNQKTHKLSLPFRPLVYGGDDITFICDGRIALDLAATCLKAFNENSDIHACAGVALVKSHYPFFRAYRLAEELCRNAKETVKRNSPTGGSAMDWQIVSGGPLRSLDAWRKREYFSGVYELTCRPYFVLPTDTHSLNDWDSFRNKLLLFLQGEQESHESAKWKQAHSRLKSLIPYLRGGADTLSLILKEWKQKGYTIPNDYCGCDLSSGFDGNRTPLLDALELLDFLAPLT